MPAIRTPEHDLPTGRQILSKFRQAIAFWWAFWLCVALATHGGLSLRTVGLVVISILCFFVGTLPLKSTVADEAPLRSTDLSPERWSLWLLLLMGITILYQATTFIALFRSGTLMVGAEFREMYFSGETYGSSTAFVMYETFVIPTAVYVLFLIAVLRRGSAASVAAACAFFILDSVVKLGRFPLYYLLFFLWSLSVLHLLSLNFRRVFILAGVAVSLAYLMVTLRGSYVGDADPGSLLSLAEKTIFNYHIAGFYILDRLTSPDGFRAEVLALPRYSLGFFDYLISLVTRRAGYEFEYPQQALNLALTEPMSIPGLGTYNAFGTNLLPYAIDGGIPLSAAVHLVLGRLLRSLCLSGRPRSLAMACVLVLVMMFGIFQPLSSSALFYIPLTIFGATVLLQRVSGKREQLATTRRLMSIRA